MAGQRTRIRFGSVSAEVLLEKTSTKPKAAQHETRRVLVEQPEHDAMIDTPAGPVVVDHKTATDPMGEPVDVSGMVHEVGQRADGALPSWPPRDAFDSAEHEPQRQPVERQAAGIAPLAERAAQMVGESETARAEVAGDLPLGSFDRVRDAPTYVPPATRVEQGVHLETGEWVDLTDRLNEVDRRTRVDGLEVVRTIPASSYASERVREAHYLCGVDPDTYKVLALLWRALRSEGKAAEVRWTKRTAQANGIIVARGELPTPTRPRPNVPAHLLLLELEWAAQIKRVPIRARGPIMADVAVDEVAAAVELVQSFAAPAPREELRDERLAKRAELLELARAGQLGEYVPPAEPMPEDLATGLDVELAEAMALAALWNREHAPA